MKDKRFALELMKEELATNKESIKEGSKSKEDRRYLLMKFNVQVEKVDN